MGFNNKIKFLYFSSLILFFIIYISYKPRLDLKKITYEEKNKSSNILSKEQLNNLKIRNNGLVYGEILTINYLENWYEIIPFTFWNRDYANFDSLEQIFNINYLNTRTSGSNNFAIGKINDEKVSYSCMNSPNIYFYNVFYRFIPRTNDLKYWQRIFLKNFKLVFYSFKPKNYQCFLVITSNEKFFNISQEKLRKLIFRKFSYSEVK